jgi:sugar/nucleoside kinase (ribokinase family)
MRRCWVIGPIAWDWPYRLPEFPRSGGFAQSIRLPGRLGGTGANVARALASRELPVAMVGYVGPDRCGTESVDDLRARGVDVTHVVTRDGETSQVLLFVERSGQRTIVGVVPDDLAQVSIPVHAVGRGDLVYFAAWRAEFASAVPDLAAAGATVASVPFARAGAALPVTHVLGSAAEVPDAAAEDPWSSYGAWTGDRLESLVLTHGAGGARVVTRGGVEEVAAVPVEAVDTTGAGDAFAAAVLAALLDGRSLRAGVDDGVRWGALAATSPESIPPTWAELADS